MYFIKLFVGLRNVSVTFTNLIKSAINLFLQIALIMSFELGGVLAKEKNDDIDDKYNYNYNYQQYNKRCGVYDPYEAFNRKIFVFNSVLDTFLLRPFAKGYGRFTNDYTKNRVGSFVNNISEPLSTVNYALQGNSQKVFESFWRFAINSTFGIAGLFDIASKVGLTPPPQTLGNTLAHYGVGPGPYIVLPIYGGGNARDMSDPLISNNLLNPINYALHSDFKLVVAGTKVLHNRSKIMPFTDYVSENSSDPYIAIREATFSQREAKIGYPYGYECPAAE